MDCSHHAKRAKDGRVTVASHLACDVVVDVGSHAFGSNERTQMRSVLPRERTTICVRHRYGCSVAPCVRRWRVEMTSSAASETSSDAGC